MILTLLSTLMPTIIIEWLVLLLFGEHHRKVWWTSVGLNVLTNVLLNLSINLQWWSWTMGATIGEVLVVVTETIGYYLVLRKWSRAFVYSFFCNAISFLVGMLYFFISVIVNP